ARMAEIYNNISDSALYRAPVGAFAVQIRSGSRLIYNNLFKNWTNTGVIRPNVYRSFTPYQVWGGATGVNPWDQNDPKLYAAGTVSGPSVGLSVVLPLQGLSANQYRHYTLRNMSPGNTPTFSIITGNTPSEGNSSTFTYAGSAGKASMMFKAGDKFEIRRVLAVMDSPATGKGDLLKVGLRGLKNTASGS